MSYSDQTGFLFGMALAAFLVFSTVMIHYEILRLISEILPRIHLLHSRIKILFAIFGVFFAHTVEVWVFALVYYFTNHRFGLGAYMGDTTGHIYDAVYFSVVVYTSLGFGDIQPIGQMRLLAGVEALVGLVMIGWSASFTFLMMEKFWVDHSRRRKKESD